MLNPDRLFSPLPAQRQLAKDLYTSIKDLPLVCPHGHVNPTLLSNPKASFGNPAELFVIPDHYIFRMLYSQGIRLEDLGIPSQNGQTIETSPRTIWKRFAEHFYLFRATPTGIWLKDELESVFGIEQKLSAETANEIYDELKHKLSLSEFSPRRLFERFNIEVLCTTDAATDTLKQHQALKQEGFNKLRPTFRPDAVVNLDTLNWHTHLQGLSEVSGQEISSYKQFIAALEIRRSFFKQMGATATDHASLSANTISLETNEAETIFAQALAKQLEPDDAVRFTAHMLFEMARMSQEDGLVMQLHIGSYRNHNKTLFETFGPDKGADIPLHTQWTKELAPLLNTYGNQSGFRLILFTLDESSYSRELAPLAGHYPALRLGPTVVVF